MSLAVHQLKEKCFEQSRLVGDRILARVERLQFQRRLHHRLHIASVNLGTGEEGEALLEDAILDDDHLTSERLEHRQEAPLCVEPRIRAELLRKGIETLDHPTDAELVVALAAVERPDDQIDDTQVEDLLLGVGVDERLLLLLNLPHQLLGVLILPRHNVGDAEVSEHDSAHVENAIVALLY